jgi:pyruvate/2-oxoglutarate dehydrogenase complex dihydrolipoamide dehydrogenase (E3) component
MFTNKTFRLAILYFVASSEHSPLPFLSFTTLALGCIPKKLFHAGALFRESIQLDSTGFGVALGESKDDTIEAPTSVVKWEVIRENIQNYIRGLNFKYRVRLREKEVTYLNKLATFVDKNTIHATDKRGNVQTITAARFLIAVGGRPAPLDCIGCELAISSDDVFSLEKNPGKTLCIGASYISLECAGFLKTLGCDVTIAVRSILLRGFDRECADRIDEYMVEHGIVFKRAVTPVKLEKLESGQIQVSFSDGSVDAYDTVLTAIGRLADTDKLGLDNLGIQTNLLNRKLICQLEQSSCPNVYAVGDVLDVSYVLDYEYRTQLAERLSGLTLSYLFLQGTPELTPVAIQAGIALSRRLFGQSKEVMDYVNICTTVFTPIEYACVGFSEDDATVLFGKDNIDVYHREFQPLEWSLSVGRSNSMAFAKVIVDKTQNEKVLGIHYVGPNAGEVMQGYGVAMKQGVYFKDLTDTVGIHPTSSEEIVSLSITKRSGEDAAAGGC